MRPASRSDREARARALLEGEGLGGSVRSVGLEGEVAAVTAPPSSVDALRRLAPRLRELGYRYVALDLAAHDRTEE